MGDVHYSADIDQPANKRGDADDLRINSDQSIRMAGTAVSWVSIRFVAHHLNAHASPAPSELYLVSTVISQYKWCTGSLK